MKDNLGRAVDLTRDVMEFLSRDAETADDDIPSEIWEEITAISLDIPCESWIERRMKEKTLDLAGFRIHAAERGHVI